LHGLPKAGTPCFSSRSGKLQLHVISSNLNRYFHPGLKLHGILDILRKHREDSMEVLLFADQPALSEVARFFVPSYSSDNCLKAREVMVMYNFNKFLKQVDRMYFCLPLQPVNTSSKLVI
jgi:hypothetical protein